MFGAVLGDVVGSSFEFENNRSPFFRLFREDGFFTDESVIMAAIVSLLNSGKELNAETIGDQLRIWTLTYVERRPGAVFLNWCNNNKNEPYNSTGNQAVVRAIPIVKFAVNKGLSLEETQGLVKDFVVITHDSIDAIRASEIYTKALYTLLVMKKENPEDWDDDKVKRVLADIFVKGGVELNQSISDLQIKIVHNVNAEFALKVVLVAILESDDFEQTLRNVVSVGGDSDGLCAIAGALAEVIWDCDDYIPELDEFFNENNVEVLNLIKSLYE